MANGDIASEAISIRQITSDTVRFWDRSGGKSWHESKPDILSMVGRMTLPADETMQNYLDYEEQIWLSNLLVIVFLIRQLFQRRSYPIHRSCA